MELIYSMRRKPLKCEPPHFDNSTDPETVRPLCTISVANIIAFSSPTELSDVEGDTWGGHVYVCDLETPWDSHKVTSTVHPISALEWDNEGKQLLVATTVGEVSVYGQKEYLLNDWVCLYSASFPGEHVIKAAFFHNGRRVVAVDKKPDAPILERFKITQSMPTLKGLGGVPVSGAAVVSSSGLVCVVMPGADTLTATDCLRPAREHVTDASFTYNNGSLVVAAAWAGAECARVAALSVSRSPPALALTPLPAVCLADPPPQMSVSWWGGADSLAVAGGSLELWRCLDKHHALHKLFAKGPLQGSTTPGGGPKTTPDCFNTVGWSRVGAWAAGGRAACGGAHAVLYRGRSVQLLARDVPHVICSRQISPGGSGAAAEAAAGASPPKKPKYGPGGHPAGATLSHGGVSALGGVAVLVDTHAQLHVFKLPQPWGDIPTPIAIQQATSALEHALVAGLDTLDLLMTLKQPLIEPLYERFTESFQRQPASFQQHYYYSWLKIRIALCRMCPSLQSSYSWLTCIVSCGAVLAAVAAALRPDDRPDAVLLDDEDDKSLAVLELKAEGAGAGAGAEAGSLRLGLQRAADVALTALAALPLAAHHTPEVWSEAGALSALRRLVGAARRADPLARLLAAAARPPLHKQDLIEECSALAASSPSVRVWESLPRTGVSSPHGKQIPLYFEYGVEPETLRYNPEPPAYAQCETIPSLAMDSIRYMYLGGGLKPARWRQCSRCGARALPAACTARHPIQKAYDSRFSSNCRCGGRWTLCSNI